MPWPIRYRRAGVPRPLCQRIEQTVVDGHHSRHTGEGQPGQSKLRVGPTQVATQSSPHLQRSTEGSAASVAGGVARMRANEATR